MTDCFLRSDGTRMDRKPSYNAISLIISKDHFTFFGNRIISGPRKCCYDRNSTLLRDIFLYRDPTEIIYFNDGIRRFIADTRIIDLPGVADFCIQLIDIALSIQEDLLRQTFDGCL